MPSMRIGLITVIMTFALTNLLNAQPIVRNADTIIRQIESLVPPPLDSTRQSDPQYLQTYAQQKQRVEQERLDLIRQLFIADPTHPKALPMMIERWALLNRRARQNEVLSETAAALATITHQQKHPEIFFVRALAGISGKNTEAGQFVEAFIRSAPKDERGGELLFRLARAQTELEAKTTAYRRSVEEYPGTYWAIMSQGALKQMAGIGKPFELDFTDAITGKPMSIQNQYRGKIVVINFWATWCSDCAAELPHMLQLQRQYKDRGVEFVGVSMDEPQSLEKLKSHVKEKGIDWPQYYQGNKFNSPFSSSWGVSSTPTVFVVDREGKLYSTSAQGKLNEVISLLLSKNVE